MTALAQLPEREQAEAITLALTRVKPWLAGLATTTDPWPIVKFKAWAVEVVELAKALPRDVQLDAAEILRRAERGIGLAIRNGQTAGVIATLTEIYSYAGKNSRGTSTTARKPTPTDYAPGQLSTNHAGIYHLTDGVTDDDFDDAIAVARHEGDLSRANVVRKIKGYRQPVAAIRQIPLIAKLAAAGHTSRQVAAQLGCSAEYLRRLARANDIAFDADAYVLKTALVDPARVLSQSVHGLEGICDGLKLLDHGFADHLNPDDAGAWSSSLAESLRCLRNLQKELNQRVQP